MELATRPERPVRIVDVELLLQELRSGRHITILDVRSGDAFRGPTGRIPGSYSLPMDELIARCPEFVSHRHEPVVVVSDEGLASVRAAIDLEQAGFSEVRSLSGGISAWLRHGFPLAHAI